ncbi:nuclear transport factor 2 family protein [Microbispora amethystogenes]|nr:nuclear transport factor 2 family protein [Microbispora amethystogenes]
MATEKEMAVRRFYEALATGDMALVDQALAPDWEAVPALRSGGGPDGWKKSIDHLRSVFSGLTVVIEHIVESGDLVAVRSRRGCAPPGGGGSSTPARASPRRRTATLRT